MYTLAFVLLLVALGDFGYSLKDTELIRYPTLTFIVVAIFFVAMIVDLNY